MTEAKNENGVGDFEAADAQMQVAKNQFTRAALSCLKGNPTAHKEVKLALDSVDAARRSLRRAIQATLASAEGNDETDGGSCA